MPRPADKPTPPKGPAGASKTHPASGMNKDQQLRAAAIQAAASYTGGRPLTEQETVELAEKIFLPYIKSGLPEPEPTEPPTA